MWEGQTAMAWMRRSRVLKWCTTAMEMAASCGKGKGGEGAQRHGNGKRGGGSADHGAGAEGRAEAVARVALAAARGADAHELAAHVAADHAQAELRRAHHVLAVAAADVCHEGVRAEALEERLWARPRLLLRWLWLPPVRKKQEKKRAREKGQ